MDVLKALTNGSGWQLDVPVGQSVFALHVCRKLLKKYKVLWYISATDNYNLIVLFKQS